MFGQQQSSSPPKEGKNEKDPKKKNTPNKKDDEESSYDYPVLVPPLFGVGPADKLPLTLASYDALESTSFFPVLWKHIQASDPSHRILHDHLQPGFWLNTLTSQSNLSASMVLNDNNNNSTTTTTTTTTTNTPAAVATGGGMGRITCEHRLSDSWIAELRGGTHMEPSVILTHWSAVPGLVFKAATNSFGQAWFSSLLLYSYNESNNNSSSNYNSNKTIPSRIAPLDFRAVTWIPLDFRNKQTVQDVFSDVPYINVFGAVQLPGLTGAIQSRISTTNLTTFDNKFYLTYNLSPLSDNNNAGNVPDLSSSLRGGGVAGGGGGPPVQVTLQKTKDYTSLSLSQVFAFDRFQFNPMEYRANHVRNTVGWTVHMEKQSTLGGPMTTRTTTATAAQAEASTTALGQPKTMDTTPPATTTTTAAATTDTTHVAVGAAWQVNRAVALKAVVRPQESQIMLGLILKRWRQPCITCSVLAQHDWRLGQTRLVGIGVELETGAVAGGSSSSSNNNNDDDGGGNLYYNDRSTPLSSQVGANSSSSSSTVPETKVVYRNGSEQS